jgi:HEAT repeat protein
LPQPSYDGSVDRSDRASADLSALSQRPLTALLHARERGDVDALIAALSDTDREVRLLAANQLRRLGSPRAVQPLLRLARDSSDQGLRILALKAVGAAGDGTAASALAEIAQADNPVDVRVTAIAAVIDLRDQRAAQLLADLVGSAELGRSGRPPHARSSLRWALDRLVELDATETVPAIERALPNLRFLDRHHAHRAIRRLRHER